MAKKKSNGNGRARLDAVSMEDRFDDKEDYLKAEEACQTKLKRIQQAYYRQGLRAILVFEGWDSAGKGGSIRRLTEPLDPRGFRVWPIAEPSPEEQGRHYLYRFWTKLPTPGTLAIFDRSWVWPVLVERVAALTAKDAWRRAYDEINDFETMLVEDGIRLVKIFLHISADEQMRRFRARAADPLKRWKLAPSDVRSRALADAYHTAYEEMFDRTDSKTAPWVTIGGDNKWTARVKVLETVIDALAHDVDIRPPAIDPAVRDAAERLLDDDDAHALISAIDAANGSARD